MTTRIELKWAGVFCMIVLSGRELTAGLHEDRRPPDEKIIVRCLYANEIEGIRILDVFVEPDRYRNTLPRENGDFTCDIRSADGTVLYSTRVNVPNKIYYDYPEDGTLRGGVTLLEDVEFDVVLPYRRSSDILNLYDKYGSVMLSTRLTPEVVGRTPRAARKAGEAEAYPVTQLLSSGDPANRINIVFLGDGYTNVDEPFTDLNGNGKWDGDQFVDLNGNGIRDAGEDFSDENNNHLYDPGEPYQDLNADGIYNKQEQPRYAKDVGAQVDDILRKSIFGAYSNHLNIYRIDSLVSQQAGADHMYVTPALERNTALNSYYAQYISRLLVTDWQLVNSIIRSSIPEIQDRYTAVVLVNSVKYGGSGGSISVSYNGSSASEVLVHEYGHTFGTLADEYFYDADPNYAHYSGAEPQSPNVTIETSRSLIKWNRWILPTTPVPTPTGTTAIGLFEGGQYFLTGIFRPKDLCRMRALGYPFCSVCDEATIKRVYTLDNVIDAAIPAEDTVWSDASGTPVSFALTLIKPVPNTLKVSWYIDGELQSMNEDSLSVGSLAPGLSTHTVEAVVRDTTGFVRHDTLETLKRRWTWYLKEATTDVAQGKGVTPVVFTLSQNYPNPFNPTTSIRYGLPMRSIVSLTVYNTLGQQIAALVHGEEEAGYHEARFDGTNLASGVYFYRLQAGTYVETKKLLLIH